MKLKDVNIEIIKELYEKMPQKRNKIKREFPEINKWVHKKDYPTVEQLDKLAKIFDYPFGYFFLDKLLKYKIKRIIRDRRKDVFISILKGKSYSELAKKYNVSNTVIRKDFRYALQRTLINNNLEEKVFGYYGAWNDSLLRIKKNIILNKDLLIKTFKI